MSARKSVASLPIIGDPRLQPVEKETSINILGGASRAHGHTYNPAAVRGLLRQPEFVETKRHLLSVRGKEAIVGIEGTIPVGALSIGPPRKDGRLSRVFSRRSRSRKRRVVRSRNTPRTPQGPTLL